jgi:hypothetical protein
VSIIAGTARIAVLAGALALLSACGKPNLESAREKISKYDAMSPQAALCNQNELGQFRSAVRQYAKASNAHGKQWPDFSYTNRRPDDLTITVLAATYLNFMPARDLGRAGWHLGELQPTWISANADSGFSRSIGDSKDALVREGKKYACEDLVKFGYALAEHELSENYWTRRMVREGFLSERPWQQKAELSARAGKNISGDLRRIARLESSLVRAIDSAQYAQR